MSRVAFAVVFALLGGCTFLLQPTRFGADAGTAADAIDAAWNAHFEAARRKDAPAACALYADEVCYEIAGQPPLRGKAAVEAMETAGMKTTDVGHLAHRSDALRVDGATAHEIGIVVGDVAVQGAPMQRVVFDYVAAWQRGRDGAWRITHLIGHLVDTAAAPGSSTR